MKSPHLDLELTTKLINRAVILGLDGDFAWDLFRRVQASDCSIFVRDLPERHLRDFFCRLVDGWTVDSYGNKLHHLDGKLTDGPNGIRQYKTKPHTIKGDSTMSNITGVGREVVTYPDGRVERYQDGLLHDGPNGEPAMVEPDGSTTRCRNGLPNDGPNGEPAVIDADGTTGRYQNGLPNDGPNGEPAIVEADGTTFRYRDGWLHDGPNGEPAVVKSDGTVVRFRDGKLHDGPNGEPAIVYPDGTVEHYRYDVKISE
jgi:hypothetical protein